MKTKLILIGLLALIPLMAFAADHSQAKYNGLCAYSVSMGKQVQTDCSVTWTDPAAKGVYCFGNQQMKNEWAKNTSANMAKADAQFTTIAAHKQAADAMNSANDKVAAAAKAAQDSANAASDSMKASFGSSK